MRGEQSSGPTHAQKSGKLTVCAEESVASKTSVELKLRCSELVSKDLFSKSVRTYLSNFIFCRFELRNGYNFNILLLVTGSIFGDIKIYRAWNGGSNLQNRSYKR